MKTRFQNSTSPFPGNNRLSFMRNAGTTALVKETNYYPFGLTHRGYNNLTTSLGSAGAKKYMYNGKELQEDFGLDWYDYGFRYYDAALARFTTIDPLTEKNHSQSGFVYAANNPIAYIDYMGLDSVYVLDQAQRPADNGTAGTSYTADVYVVQNGELVYVGENEKSTYPNSKSTTDNSAKYNTAKEGEHNFDNQYGHKTSSKKGLNIYDNATTRTTEGTKPDGTDVDMTGVNDHSGASNNGGASSRGSKGCMTTDPAANDSYLNVFDWSGTITRQTSDGAKTYTGTTGNSSGKYYIYRGTANMPANFRNDHKLPIILPGVTVTAPAPQK
jgi:RHS repeat-associated protein